MTLWVSAPFVRRSHDRAVSPQAARVGRLDRRRTCHHGVHGRTHLDASDRPLHPRDRLRRPVAGLGGVVDPVGTRSAGPRRDAGASRRGGVGDGDGRGISTSGSGWGGGGPTRARSQRPRGTGRPPAGRNVLLSVPGWRADLAGRSDPDRTRAPLVPGPDASRVRVLSELPAGLLHRPPRPGRAGRRCRRVSR